MIRWRGTWLVSAACSLYACAGVLDLDQREDAVERLCACDAQLPQLDGDCREVLSARLEQVSQPTREAWLAFFVERCGGNDAVCMDAYECYAQPGTCAPTSCVSSKECCDYASGQRCFDGMCQSCRGDGASCSNDDDCCSSSCDGTSCVTAM